MHRFSAWISVLLLAAGVALTPLPAGAAPGAPAITGHPAATVETPYAAFSFLAPGAASYECRVFPAGTPDGSRPTYGDCGVTGSHLTSVPADGQWTFEVRGVDGGGAGPSATRDWTVTSQPVVQWIVEPQGSYSARVVSATFTAAGASAYECRLDGGDFAPCGSGRDGFWTSGQLPAGPHALQVRALRGGVPGPVATATFTVTDPLGISWLEEPGDVTDGRTVTARFTAQGAHRYECRLVRTDPLPDPLPDMVGCGSGVNGLWTSDELADGAWRLDVRAVEGAETGQVASSAFVVDVQGTVQWVSRPPATIDGSVASAVFRAPGVHAYDCRAYRTDPVPETLPDFEVCGGGQQGWWTSGVLADGAWRLDVRPRDARDPRPVASTTFTIAPQREIEWVVRPAGTLPGTGYAAAFRSRGAHGYECRVDDGDWFTCGSGREGHVTGTGDPGPHQLDVRGVAPTGTSPVASTTFTLAPTTGASSDATIVLGAQGTTTVPWTAFAWTAEDVDCFRWKLDGDDDLSTQGCYSPGGNGTYAVAQAFGSLPDGEHVLRVQARSTSGDYGQVATRTFTVDTSTASRPQVISGPTGTVATPWAAFSWAATDAECFRWELDGDDDLSTQGCYSPVGNGAYASTQGFGNLADGPHVLRIQGRSPGGSFGELTTTSFTVDTSAATRPRFTSGPAQGATVTRAAVAYSWTGDQVECFRWELDGDGDLTDQGCYSPVGNGAYALTQAFNGLGDGPHTLRVQGRSAGNAYGPVTTRSFTVDTSAATRPRFVSGPAEDATIPTAAVALSWVADQVECFRWELDGDGDLTDQGCYSPSGNGAYAQGQAFTNLTDGSHVLRVQARSSAGTYGPVTTRAFRVNSGPWVTVSSRPRQVLPSGTSAMAWSAPSAACFRWELDGADDDLSDQGCYDPIGNGAYAQQQAFTDLGDGAHVLRVQAQGTGGSYGPVTRVPFTVETKAPETTITSGPTGFVSSRAASFTFSADETATFQCSLDGAAYAACASPLQLDQLDQGGHTLAVRAIDLAGKTDATPATRSWTVDTVDPTVIDLDGPSGTIVDPNFVAVLTFLADEPGGFECRLVPAAFATCGSPTSYADLPDGQYRFEVRAVDRAGNRSAVAYREWSLVTDPPETTITSAPSGVVRQTSATVTFTSPDSPVSFECEVDGAAWATCASPLPLTGLDQGAHTVRVRAVLQGTLRDPSPATVTWTVDTVGPTTTITSGPSGTVGAGPRTFTFVADEPSSFTCVLDGGTPYACSSPEGLGTLGSGAHTFTVRATDDAGNVGEAAARSWVVDAEAPVVTITGRPAAVTNQTSGSVAFTVDDASASVECRLDGGTWSACASPVTRTGLAEGEHVLEVRATDAAGNVSDPAAAQWRVDTTAPVVTITSAPVLPVSSPRVTIGFTVSEPADTVCRVDGGAFTPCTSPFEFTGLSDGVHRLEVRATDAAGNTGLVAGRDVTVDTVPPTVTIIGGPTGTIAQTSATFSFTVDEAPVTTRCSLDGAAFTVCSSPVTYAGLDQGVHTLRVQATDTAGNTGAAAPRTWTVDTPEPETTIDTAPRSPSNDTTPSFAFSSDTPGATFECLLDGAATWTSCASGLEVGPLADGSHTFRVRAVSGGLTDPTPATHTWTVDATDPVVTVTQRPTGVTSIPESRFVFTTSEPGVVECQVDGGPWQVCSSPFDPVLPDGAHSVRIRVTDAADNVGQTAVMSWTVDGTEPDVVITSGPSGDHASRTATYTFTVDDPTATVECLLDGGTWSPCSSPRTFTGLEDGPHSFSVRATDPAGNRGAEGRSFFVDATAPVVSFTDGPAQVTTARTARLVFTVDDAVASRTCRLDGTAYTPCTSPVDLTGLADGSHSFRVEATDAFGNVGTATRTWVVDNTPPTVTITDGPSGTVTTNDVSFSFVADDTPVTYECRLDAAAFTTCASPLAYDDLAAGAHRFEVRATNGAGVTGPVASRDFTVAVQGDPAIAVTVQARTMAGAALSSTGLGDDFVVRASLTNSGPVASDTTVLTVPLSSDLTLAGGLPAGCTSPDADGPVTCAIGVVGAGATTVVDLRVDASFTCTVYGDSAAQASAVSSLRGTTGDDVICGGGGGDEILGRGGNDVVWGYGPTGLVSTSASVAYGPGSRSATALPASMMIDGPDGADTITTAQGADIVRAQDGDDVASTGAGVDRVEAGDGNDRVSTGTGESDVTGGRGVDSLTGGPQRDVVSGGDDADTITTFDGADAVSGDGGNDTINAGPGGNTVNGGDGDDRITGSAGLVSGGDGNDTVSGTTGSVNGDAGNDTISNTTGPVNGNDGNDTIRGTAGVVIAGPGNDSVTGTSGPDEIHGNAGEDAITSAGGDDTVTGDEDGDRINAGAGANTVNGGSGDDRITGSAGVISGGDGNDMISSTTGTANGDDGNDTISSTTGPAANGGAGDDTIIGTTGTADGEDGDDRITGTGAANVINGGSGSDVVNAGGGADTIDGGDLPDTINGEGGNDTIRGSFGADTISGGDGVDILSGDTGDDTILGDAGADVVNGDNGMDRLFGGTGNDRITGGILQDELNGEAGDDVLNGEDGPDTLFGGTGNDTLAGNDGTDTLRGNDGEDVALGGPDADHVLGGDGHDYLAGGADADYVNGQLGRDVVRGGDGSDELDGGGTDATRSEAPRDHWNRLYGDAGGADICHFGPGLDTQMTNYRDPSCELRDEGLSNPGEGWLNGSAIRLDRVRNDGDYPG
ncbi:Ig-like domain-containing protein [Nocardioides sp. STR2]|uniref:Ig-like domain-containing protein n=1 Tax=Nocardioides pini TaxID=2975053 RepID=A0ABT4C702_9ACTN|nr:Ig-like domain-containing protein [Nocardioides pini]MCY4724744.1 Ig-like domain-containing protein [Nocardioides pini]